MIDSRLTAAISVMEPGWWYKMTYLTGPTGRKRTVSGAFQCMFHNSDCTHGQLELMDLAGKVYKAPIEKIIYLTRYNNIPQNQDQIQNKY